MFRVCLHDDPILYIRATGPQSPSVSGPAGPVTPVPSRTPIPGQSPSKTLMLITPKEFEHEFAKEGPIFAVVVREAEQAVESEQPPEVTAILHEFEDVSQRISLKVFRLCEISSMKST